MLIKRDDLKDKGEAYVFLLSWFPSELLEAAVKYRLENIYDFECELDGNGQFARCLQAAEGESVLYLDIVESFGLREELEQYWYRYLDEDYIFWEMEWECSERSGEASSDGGLPDRVAQGTQSGWTLVCSRK